MNSAALRESAPASPVLNGTRHKWVKFCLFHRLLFLGNKSMKNSISRSVLAIVVVGIAICIGVLWLGRDHTAKVQSVKTVDQKPVATPNATGSHPSTATKVVPEGRPMVIPTGLTM